MIFWLIDMSCGACHWRDRTMHTRGDHLIYVCPRCSTPINACRLIGVIS